MKKIVCALLALLLALSCAAFAESDLDAANARIAELEALVAKYKPFYDARIVAEYGDGQALWLDDVKPEYDSYVELYAQYGIDVEEAGLAQSLREDVVSNMMTNIIMMNKAAELGLDSFTDEDLAAIDAQAQANYEEYLSSYYSYFYPEEEEITPEMRAEAVAYFEADGMTIDVLREELRSTDIADRVYSYIVDGVHASDAEVEQTYRDLIEKNKSDYASDYTYCADRMSNVTIAWNPEGYRAVKQVLIGFDDAQNTKLDEINGQLVALDVERTAEETEDAPRRPDAEIQADIDACNAELDALYAELLPRAEEAKAAFDAGTGLDELIAKYNSDPGMTQEPTATAGYPVCAGCSYWDPAFTEAAMSLEKIGDLSAPARGSYGYYLIYYLADIPAGEVPIDSLRDELRTEADAAAVNNAYAAQIAAWTEEAGVVYHFENLA